MNGTVASSSRLDAAESGAGSEGDASEGENAATEGDDDDGDTDDDCGGDDHDDDDGDDGDDDGDDGEDDGDDDDEDSVEFEPGETRLTTSAASEQRPAWCPEGERLAFDSNASGNQDIWIRSLLDGTETQLTTSALFDQHPDWSPDGCTIAYAAPQFGGAGVTDLFLIPAGGGTPVLLDGDLTQNDRFPSWSPDGTQIAYTKGGEIFVIAASGGTPVQITTAGGLHPSWSPDGSAIAFLSSRSGNNDIWTIPSTGGTATQLTTDVANDGAPDWSPDGEFIAFQSNRSGNNDLWIVPSGGGPAAQITTDPGIDVQPDWSPDGEVIAFARDGDLWVTTFPPATSADLSVETDFDENEPVAGSTVTCEIEISNEGPAVAARVQILCPLPEGLALGSHWCSRGSFDPASGSWTLEDVAVDETQTLTMRALVQYGTAGSTIVSTVSIRAADEPDVFWENNVDSAELDVLATVDVLDASGLVLVDRLGPARPSPFRERTTIEFDLATSGPATVTVLDVSGRRVKTLLDGRHAAGRYRPSWDGRDAQGRPVTAGVYFVRLETPFLVDTRKLLRVR